MRRGKRLSWRGWDYVLEFTLIVVASLTTVVVVAVLHLGG
jgi:hypothetical protein